MRLRHQLASHSPVGADAWVRAAAQALRVGRDPRRALEALLRREYAADDVLLCSSGTQALQVALAATLADRRTTTVALPAYTCFDVASAAVGTGASIALYDVDPATLAPDVASLERTLAAGARVAVVASLYGVPIAWEPLAEIARRHDALLVEDASQGHGASWRGLPLGALGAVSTISFGRGKGWSGGSGGAVLARGASPSLPAALPERGASADAKVAAGLGAQWALGRPALYGIPRSLPGLGLGETIYKPPVAPSAMTRGAAAVALSSFVASRAEGGSRRRSGEALAARLRELHGLSLARVPAEGVAGWLRFPILLDAPLDAATWQALEPFGVGPSYPTTLAALDVVRARLVGAERRWPGADAIVRRLVTLPAHSRVRTRDREALLATLARRQNSSA